MLPVALELELVGFHFGHQFFDFGIDVLVVFMAVVDNEFFCISLFLGDEIIGGQEFPFLEILAFSSLSSFLPLRLKRGLIFRLIALILKRFWLIYW